jgi:hypothetical protein
MPSLPPCTVPNCPNTAQWALPSGEGIARLLPSDCLCTPHWNDLRAHDEARAYQYFPLRGDVARADSIETQADRHS